MDIIEIIKNELVQAIKKAGYSFEQKELSLTHPTFLKQGDYATSVALVLARASREQEGGQSKNPFEIGQVIVAHISKHEYIQKIEVAPQGFINFFLSERFFVDSIKDILEKKEEYGHSDELAGKTYLIEHTSANPNKAMHLGHLLNNVFGMAVSNIWESQGARVIRDYVDNNRGIAIAKLMWGYLKFARVDGATDKAEIAYWFDHQDEWVEPSQKNIRPDRFVDDLYVKATEDCRQNEQSEKIVRQMVVDWEAGDKKNRELWKKVLSYSYEGQAQTLDRLGSKIDTIWHESDHYEQGKDLVSKGLEKGIFKKLEDGAILTSLEKDYDLPETIVVKSDGTALYITQDIALTKLKKETLHPDKLFWVIGADQRLAMRQLFAVCEQLGIGKREEFTHLSYGYLTIKGQGKMSSRAGNVVYIDDLLDTAAVTISKKIKEGIFTEKELKEVAEKIGVSAVKYTILKVSPNSNIKFDVNHAVDFNGDSGPYIQYAYARAQSVLQKAKEKGIVAHGADSLASETTDLEKLLYRFREVVATCARENDPHYLCTYLFQLAQTFNAFYANNPIADETNELGPHRVATTTAFAYVLGSGLRLLGMEVLDRM